MKIQKISEWLRKQLLLKLFSSNCISLNLYLIADNSAFDFQKLLWGLTGVIIFIATAGIMGVVMKIRIGQGK